MLAIQDVWTALHKSEELAPHSALPHFALGSWYLFYGPEPMKRQIDAKSEIWKGLRIDPRSAIGYTQLRYATGPDREALRYSSKAVALDPKDAKARWALAIDLASLHRKKEARLQWKAYESLVSPEVLKHPDIRRLKAAIFSP